MKSPANLSVTVIGSGAVRAHPTRGGPCYLLSIDGRNLLFDCGRCAVHNLSRFGVPVETIFHVFITHLHFDHVCDLPLLLLLSWNNGRARHLPIHGPKGIAAFLDAGVRTAYAADIASRLAHGKSRDGLSWDCEEITREGRVHTAENFTVDAIATKHAGLLNYSYRIATAEKIIVITSDSEPDPRLVEFFRNADLLLVECSGTREFYNTQAWGSWHMTPEDVGRIASEAGVKQVVLKHLVIESFSADLGISEKMAATVRSLHPTATVLVAEDGMRLDLTQSPAH